MSVRSFLFFVRPNRVRTASKSETYFGQKQKKSTQFRHTLTATWYGQKCFLFRVTHTVILDFTTATITDTCRQIGFTPSFLGNFFIIDDFLRFLSVRPSGLVVSITPSSISKRVFRNAYRSKHNEVRRNKTKRFPDPHPTDSYTIQNGNYVRTRVGRVPLAQSNYRAATMACGSIDRSHTGRDDNRGK